MVLSMQRFFHIRNTAIDFIEESVHQMQIIMKR